MLRVRIDGGRSRTEQLRVIAGISHRVRPRHRRHHRPAEHPVHWIRRRGRARDLAAPRGRRPADDRGLRRHPARHPRQPGRRHRRRRDHRPDPGHRRDHRAASSATPSCQPAAQVQDRRSPGTRASTSCTRSTTSRSSASCTPSSGAGYDLWVGGGLSTAPAAGRAPRRLRGRRSEAADVWHGVISIFRDYGYRRLRNKARLKFLLAEWGPAKFREVLETEYLGHAAPRRPAAGARRPARATTSACTGRRTAATTSARAPVVGRISGDAAHRPRRPVASRRHRPRCASRRTRSSSCSTSPPDRGRRPRGRARRLGLSASAQPVPPPHDGLHRHRVLQARHRRDQGHRRRPPSPSSSAGSPTSPTGSTPRSRSTSTAAPTPAPASRPPTSASRARSSPTDGEQEPGFQVHLGGGLASADRDEAGLGRTVRGLKVTGRRPARLRRARRAPLRSPSARPARRSPSGPTASDEEELLQ